MKVRMLVSIAGLAEPLYDLPEFSFAPGDEVRLHPDLAKAWIDCGHAEEVTDLVVEAKPRKSRKAVDSNPDAKAEE